MSTGLPSPPRTPPGSPSPDPRTSEERSDGGSGERDAPSRPDPRGGIARWAPSPSLGRAELLWVVLGGIALAALTSWPLILHLPSRIAPDLGDPVRTTWQVAWVGHAMLHDPLHLFNANAFYPHPFSLAFSDSLLGYGPAAFIGHGTVAALVRGGQLRLIAVCMNSLMPTPPRREDREPVAPCQPRTRRHP